MTRLAPALRLDTSRTGRGWLAGLATFLALAVYITPAPAERDDAIHRWRLDNGLTVLFRHNPAADTVAIVGFVRVPMSVETAQQCGIRHLVATMLTRRPAGSHDSDPMQQLGRYGAAAATSVDYDSVQVTVAGLAEYFDRYLMPIHNILFDGQFAWEQFMSVRAAQQLQLSANRESSIRLARELADERLFAGTSFARPLMGTEASLRNLRQADVRRFHQQYWRPNNTVLSISGPMAPEYCRSQVESTFGSVLPGTATLLPSTRLSSVESAYVHRPWPTSNAVVMMLGRAPTPEDEMYAAIEVLGALLAGGQGSLLWQDLRETEPLAYGLDATVDVSSDAGTLQVATVCEAARAADVLMIMRRRVQAMETATLSGAQIQRAIAYVSSRYLHQSQSNLSAATAIGKLEVMVPGRGPELDASIQRRILTVTMGQVKQAARYCSSDAVWVQIGGVPPDIW
jgi:zinc protease